MDSGEYEWSQAGCTESCINYSLSSLTKKYLACGKRTWLQLLTRWSMWSKWGQNTIFFTTLWRHAVRAVDSQTSVCTKGVSESLMDLFPLV